jgi:hypothetical protein
VEPRPTLRPNAKSRLDAFRLDRSAWNAISNLRDQKSNIIQINGLYWRAQRIVASLWFSQKCPQAGIARPLRRFDMRVAVLREFGKRAWSPDFETRRVNSLATATTHRAAEISAPFGASLTQKPLVDLLPP